MKSFNWANPSTLNQSQFKSLRLVTTLSVSESDCLCECVITKRWLVVSRRCLISLMCLWFACDIRRFTNVFLIWFDFVSRQYWGSFHCLGLGLIPSLSWSWSWSYCLGLTVLVLVLVLLSWSWSYCLGLVPQDQDSSRHRPVEKHRLIRNPVGKVLDNDQLWGLQPSRLYRPIFHNFTVCGQCSRGYDLLEQPLDFYEPDVLPAT